MLGQGGQARQGGLFSLPSTKAPSLLAIMKQGQGGQGNSLSPIYVYADAQIYIPIHLKLLIRYHSLPQGLERPVNIDRNRGREENLAYPLPTLPTL